MNEELVKQLEELKKNLEGAVDAKVKAQIEAQIKALTDKIKAMEDQAAEIKAQKERIEKLEKDATENQKALNEMIAKNKDIQASVGQPRSIKGAIGAKLSEQKDKLKAYTIAGGNQGKGFTVDLDQKTVGDMSSSGSLTGSYFVTPDVVPGVTTQPYEETHMRNVLPVGTTSSNVIRYVRDNGGEGGPDMVAEGGTKPQQDRDLAIYDANVKKIAVYFRVPEEMIEDIAYLQSFLGQIGMEEVAALEDTQILYGSGSGQNLSGLFTNGTLFNPGAAVVTDANRFDVIRAARMQLRKAKLGGALIGFVSPEDFFTMTSHKDSTYNYMFLGGGNGIALANPFGIFDALNAGGVTIAEHTAVNTGDFLVMQPRSAQIFDRMATQIRFYDQDQDNAIKNLITIVIEKRLALPIYRPAGIVKGTFGSALSDLANSSAGD